MVFSRHPKEAPRLEIRLDLDAPGVVFCSGSVIRGTLFFRYEDVAAIDDASVVNASTLTFSGLAKTKIEVSSGSGKNRSSTYYRGRAPLLNLTFPLVTLSSHNHLDGKGRDWHFAITVPHNHLIDAYPPLPSHWHTNDSYWSEFAPDARFSGDTSLPLPPSFRYDTWKCRAFIEYTLTAHLWLSRGHSGPLRADRQVTLAPLSPAVHAPTRQAYDRAAIRSLRLMPENEGRKLTFKEKAGGFFHRSGLPLFEFQCISTLPQTLRLGERASFTLQLVPDTHQSTAPLPASLTLKHCSIVVNAQTIARVPRYGTYVVRENQHVVFQQVATSFTGAILDKGNGYSITTDLAGPVIGFEPTFATHNISREYWMRVAWLLECVGEEVKIVNEMPFLALAGQINHGPPAPMQQPAFIAPQSQTASTSESKPSMEFDHSKKDGPQDKT